MKATEQYFPIVRSVMLYKVVLMQKLVSGGNRNEKLIENKRNET